MENKRDRIPRSINVDGSQAPGGRYLVVIDGHQVLLRPKSFKYFVALTVGRKRARGGWIHRNSIEDCFDQQTYLWRLKQDILESISWPWLVFHNNRHGSYRLNAEPDTISFNIWNIRQFPDAELQRLLEANVIE